MSSSLLPNLRVAMMRGASRAGPLLRHRIGADGARAFASASTSDKVQARAGNASNNNNNNKGRKEQGRPRRQYQKKRQYNSRQVKGRAQAQNVRRGENRRRPQNGRGQASPLSVGFAESMSQASASQPLAPHSSVVWLSEEDNAVLMSGKGGTNTTRHYVDLAKDLVAKVSRSDEDKVWSSMNPIGEFLLRMGRIMRRGEANVPADPIAHSALLACLSNPEALRGNLTDEDAYILGDAVLANTYKWAADDNGGRLLIAAARNAASPERRNRFIRDVSLAAEKKPAAWFESQTVLELLSGVLQLRTVPGTRDAVEELLARLVERSAEVDAVSDVLLETTCHATVRQSLVDSVLDHAFGSGSSSSTRDAERIVRFSLQHAADDEREELLDGIIGRVEGLMGGDRDLGGICTHIFEGASSLQRTRLVSAAAKSGNLATLGELLELTDGVDGDADLAAAKTAAIADVTAHVRAALECDGSSISPLALRIVMKHAEAETRSKLVNELIKSDKASVSPKALAEVATYIDDEEKVSIYSSLKPSLDSAVASLSDGAESEHITTLQLALQCATEASECEDLLSAIVADSSVQDMLEDPVKCDVLLMCAHIARQFDHNKVPSYAMLLKEFSRKVLRWSASQGSPASSADDIELHVALVRALLDRPSGSGMEDADSAMQLVLSSMWAKGKDVCSHRAGYDFVVQVLADDQPDVQRMVTNGILSCARGIGSTEYGSKILLAILEKGTDDDSGSRKRFIQSSIVPFAATWASTEHGRELIRSVCEYADASDAKMIRASAVATGN